MRKVRWVIVMCWLVIGAGSVAGQTPFLDVVPSLQQVMLGEQATVMIKIAGLGDGTAPSLGTFDLDLNFDPALLSCTSATFGDPTLGDQLDLNGLGSLSVVTPDFGVVNIFELSFDSPEDLDALQAGEFVLATITCETLASGTSPLSITVNALGDALGESIEAEIGSGSVVIMNPPPSADIAFVRKTSSPNPVTVGTSLRYDLTFINNGPGTATSITVTDTLPAEVTFVSATGGCDEAGGTVTCSFGNIGSGTQFGPTIVVIPTVVGTITNTARATSTAFDPNPDNNEGTEKTTVNPSPPLPVTCNGFPVTMGCTVNGVPNQLCRGTMGNDRIDGTTGDDVINSLGGRDEVRGFRGNDTICGGSGRDTINGGAGRDMLFGMMERDTLNGGDGNDRLFGGADNDMLNGNNGDDRLNGLDDTDTCDGGNQVNSDTAVNCETVINVP